MIVMMWRVAAAVCLLLLAGCADGAAVRAGSESSEVGGVSSPQATPGDNIASDLGGGPVGSATGVLGRVTSSRGDPVVTASVARTPVDSHRPVTQEAAVTGDDGRYFWALPPGLWEITISAPGFRTASRRVTVVQGQRATLDFVLQPS
jgi:hypothetical protein